MKIMKPFPFPEEPPVIPQGLVDCVLGVWSDLKKVDIMRARKGGWQVVNAITLEEGDDPSEVTEAIKMCADHHATAQGESGKYRAQLWSHEVGRNGTRNYNTFQVQCPGDEDPTQTQAEEEFQELRTRWMELFGAQQEFAQMLMKFSEFSIERVVVMSKQHGEQLNPLTEVIQELIGPYRDGLQMQSRAIKEMGDMRVRQHLAEAKVQDNGKFWEMFGPAVQMAAAKASTHFFGGGNGGPSRTTRTRTRSHDRPPGSRPGGTHTPPPSSPGRTQPPKTPRPEAGPAPQPEPEPVVIETDAVPNTLHELARALMDSMGSDTLVKVTRVLEEDQADHFMGIAEAEDDTTSAECIVALTSSLMSAPSVLLQVQHLFGPDHIQAFQHLAVLAKQHLERNEGGSSTEPAKGEATDAPRSAATKGPEAPGEAKSRAKTGAPSRFAPPSASTTSTDPAPSDASPGASTDATPRPGADGAGADDPRT